MPYLDGAVRYADAHRGREGVLLGQNLGTRVTMFCAGTSKVTFFCAAAVFFYPGSLIFFQGVVMLFVCLAELACIHVPVSMEFMEACDGWVGCDWLRWTDGVRDCGIWSRTFMSG